MYAKSYLCNNTRERERDTDGRLETNVDRGVYGSYKYIKISQAR